uniref:Uncharacterized protein n=1 Tax=Anguilla anguilla TaxID=7936 RepID=A0A0E9TKF9_ANGAN
MKCYHSFTQHCAESCHSNSEQRYMMIAECNDHKVRLYTERHLYLL